MWRHAFLRLDRIEHVRDVSASFGRPEGFDAFAYLVFSVATLSRICAIEVLLRTDLATAQRETFDIIAVLEPAEEGAPPFAQAYDLAWFARELSWLPFDFEIRHLEALHDALQAPVSRLQCLA